MNRTEQLRAMVDVNGRGLEIGASHAPIFPKREGFDVEVLDHASADDLRRHYGAAGLDISGIEEVDWVSDGRPLHDIIPHRSSYDYVFSSHAIEHVTDFIGYLKSCELLLKPGGVVAMAVPDKRYTFDALRPITTTGQMLEANVRTQRRHTPALAFDHVANASLLSKSPTWSRDTKGTLSLMHDVVVAKALFDDSMRADAPYHDIHAWVFTPNSFRLILHDLDQLGMLELREVSLVEQPGLEFHVALSKAGQGHGLSRLDLHKQVLREQVFAGMQMLAGEDNRMAAMLDLLAAPAHV